MKELFNTLSNISQFFIEKRFVYFESGPGQHIEVQSKVPTPLERAERKFRCALDRIHFMLIREFRRLFANGKTHKKIQEFAKFGKKVIKNINMTPAELSLMKVSGKYKYPKQTSTSYAVDKKTAMHFEVSINDKAQIESGVVWENRDNDNYYERVKHGEC